MAMAVQLLAAPSLACPARGASRQPSSEAFSGPRNAIEHGARGLVLRRSSWDASSCRGPAEPAAHVSAAAGLSSSGRDGGACCSAISRSSRGASRNAVELGWSARSGGLLRLDVSGLSALRQRGNEGAVPRRLTLLVFAEKPDLTNVAATIVRVGRQGLEAGTKFVPESVPRPVAQAGVALGALFLGSFLLKSLFSTFTFILAIGAISYFAYMFLTKGESSSSSGGDSSSGKAKSSDDALEEARRIMEKYK